MLSSSLGNQLVISQDRDRLHHVIMVYSPKVLEAKIWEELPYGIVQAIHRFIISFAKRGRKPPRDVTAWHATNLPLLE
jgi:hypothetical protein